MSLLAKDPSDELEINRQMLDEAACLIYDKYCSRSATLLINLPFAVSKALHVIFAGESARSRGFSHRLTRTLSNVFSIQAAQTDFTSFSSAAQSSPISVAIDVPFDVFDRACKEILNLMTTDSFRRFRGSQEYREFVVGMHTQGRLGASIMVELVDEHA